MEKDLNLLNEFPPPTLEEWKKSVEDSLKGADFERTMHTKTYEGVTLKPIYTKADTEKLPFADSHPGAAPYLRGNDPKSRLDEGWLIAQNHSGTDLKALNGQLLAELSSGLTAINFSLKHDDDLSGVEIETVADLQTLFAGIDLIAAPPFLQLDMGDSRLLGLLEEYLASQGVELKSFKAGIGFDPTSEFARKGYLSQPLDELWQQMAKNITWAVEKAPGVRCLSIDGSVYAAAGASSVQELGFVLSTAIGYIQGLQMSGFAIDRIAPLFQVKLTLGSNFFLEIAKLRAFRLLWAEMVKAFGGSAISQQIWIHGKTASFNKAIADIHVNLLRTATEGFAGVIGGADSLEIASFDALSTAANEFSAHLARNQQLILKEEAHFGKVIDPAGGCYYIESLTQELADAAWKLMQELEANRGMIKSLRDGKIHPMIASVAQARIDAANKRRDVYVGVNMYANPQETVPLPAAVPTAANPVRAVELEAGPLPRLRAVQDIEALRRRVAAASKPPQVYLLNMGSLADYKARADFAAGFFQVGGFEVTSPAGFAGVSEAVAAARASGAAAFCICSTDDNYRQLVPELCAALPGQVMILAGYPKDMVDAYKEQGIDLFIHIKADAVSTLSQLADLMEVAK